MRDFDTDQDTIARPELRVENGSSRQTGEKSHSRAEHVRARHGTRQPAGPRPVPNTTGGRASSQKLRAVHYVVPSRPVVIRGTVSPLPVRKLPVNKTRKQYKIALSTPGAEVRLPAISLGRPGWRLLSGLIAICMLVSVYALNNLPQFQFGTAKVTGAKRVTAADINEVLKVEGMAAIQAKPAEMTTSLQKAFPELSKVSVSVSIPASLNVSVTERQPVLFWDQGDTKSCWIDRDGYAFPIRGDAGVKLVAVQAEGNPPTIAAASSETTASSSSSTLPNTASNPPKADSSGQPFLTPDLVAAILRLGAQAPAGTPVIYNPRYGLGWKDPEGWQVYFGSSLKDMDTKLAVYKAIVEQLSKQGIKPVMISVEFPHAPFYRLEK